MIEFDDLTPWSLEETQTFYDLDWFLPMMDLVPRHVAGLKIRDGCTNEFNRRVCAKTIKVKPGFIDSLYTEVICFMRQGHKGKCVCWTPAYGIISWHSRDLMNLAELKIPV